MEDELLSRLDSIEMERHPPGFAVAPGIVSNNFDATGEGRVQVKVPAMPAFEVWARVVSVGAGDGRGLCWIPQMDDEVLVAFSHNDASSAFVLGGLWSTRDRAPLTVPTDFLTKRVIKTGMTSGLGHEVMFDDLLQAITITSASQQKVTIDPFKIELKNTAGTLTITMDNTTQAISIQAAAKLELKAAQVSIEGVQIDLKATTINVQSAGPCNVQGLPIKLN